MAKKCKRAGSYRVCRSYDRENEMQRITVVRPATFSTDGEHYRFWFHEPSDAKSWYKELRGVTDVEDLLRIANGSQHIELEEVKD